MKFEDTKLGEARVVSVEGRIDGSGADLFQTHCTRHLDAGDKSLVLDFTELEYLSSAGLRAILSLAKTAKASGGKLVLAGVSGTVKEVLEISGFDSMFTLHAKLEDAAGEVL